MSTTEILITLAGLYLGYWIVAKLIMDKPKAQPAPVMAQASQNAPMRRRKVWGKVRKNQRHGLSRERESRVSCSSP